MKKYYTVFRINPDTGLLEDKGWTRHKTKESCIEDVLDFNYNEELVILPIYVPTKLQ